MRFGESTANRGRGWTTLHRATPERRELWEMLDRYLRNTEVSALGSRAHGRRLKPYADLDPAVVCDRPLDNGTLVDVRSTFDDSGLPFLVDRPGLAWPDWTANIDAGWPASTSCCTAGGSEAARPHPHPKPLGPKDRCSKKTGPEGPVFRSRTSDPRIRSCGSYRARNGRRRLSSCRCLSRWLRRQRTPWCAC